MATRGFALIIFGFLHCFGCGQATEDTSSCANFTFKGSEKLNEYLFNGKNEKHLSEALEQLNKAINCDSLNSDAYQKKISVLILLNRHQESLKCFDKVFELSKGNNAQVLVTKALVYEELGKTDSSKVTFKHAFDIYNRRLEQHPADSLTVICEKIFLISVVEGKDRAFKIFEPYLSMYPHDPTIKLYEIIFKDFDREALPWM